MPAECSPERSWPWHHHANAFCKRLSGFLGHLEHHQEWPTWLWHGRFDLQPGVYLVQLDLNRRSVHDFR